MKSLFKTTRGQLLFALFILLPYFVEFLLPVIFYRGPIEVGYARTLITTADLWRQFGMASIWFLLVFLPIVYPMRKTNFAPRVWPKNLVLLSIFLFSAMGFFVFLANSLIVLPQSFQQIVFPLSLLPAATLIIIIYYFKNVAQQPDRYKKLLWFFILLNIALIILLPIVTDSISFLLSDFLAILYACVLLKISLKKLFLCILILLGVAVIGQSAKLWLRAHWYHGQLIHRLHASGDGERVEALSHQVLMPVLSGREARHFALATKVFHYKAVKAYGKTFKFYPEVFIHAFGIKRPIACALVSSEQTYTPPPAQFTSFYSLPLANYLVFYLNGLYPVSTTAIFYNLFSSSFFNYPSYFYYVQAYHLHHLLFQNHESFLPVNFMLMALIQRLASQGVHFAVLLKTTPATLPFWHNADYKALPAVIIPRFFWKNKPVENNGQYFGHEYGFAQPSDVYTTFAMGGPIEAWLNAGWFGILIAPVLYGFLFRLIWMFFIGKKPSIGNILIGMVVVLNATRLEADAGIYWGNILHTIIIYWVLEVLIRRYLSRMV